ncbi:LAME_0A01640g1_1 [Lachancea meyersii CBS 8951]|uniref:LAME_0A01640g1_1 n=1 Tax=Lachancea meyersii CBS 8951 TaxID=1266667 RepID=A0A1G4IM05_9SACH|nr:LAME_0A01640g1_1 [Lachancea meyersii CBS 8951]
MDFTHRLNGIGGLAIAVLIFSSLQVVLSALIDVKNSADVYTLLNSSSVPVFIMMYMHGCRYCKELEPDFAYLETLFSGELAVVKVDGKQATLFARDMGVHSFPELFLFSAANDISGFQDNTYLGKFHSNRNLASLALFVSHKTGAMARWPESRVRTVDSELTSIDWSRASLLAFVSPWMDPEAFRLFAGEQSTCALENMARSSDLQIFRIDASSSSTSVWTHEFRIQMTPTLIFLIPTGSGSSRELRIEWHRGCSKLNEQAQEILNTIVAKCGTTEAVSSSNCNTYLHNLPGVSVRELGPVSASNCTEFDPNFSGEFYSEYTTNGEDNYDEDNYDEDDENDDDDDDDAQEWIFDALREL